ncbi:MULTISPECIES: precorrin-6A synthase (deacetylating) [unclassified Novosphingobium]|uniref:precorrin-6A synthase (deacetylating) n=1 Tax=unclassified Novosphingobium TaxID=2644732 RepID=UPI001358A731|nr:MULTISPECIES: precorrin-6A synthase (deacetylating) [unclassified Novosphingobium]
MMELSLIGIGTGNPDHLTLQAIRAMNDADLILLPRKGSAKSDLLDLRRGICDAVLTRPVRIAEFNLPTRDAEGEYLGAVNAWHDAIADVWMEQIALHLPDGGRLALLVWGDPSLYDSTLRITERLQRGGLEIDLRVVPGITSIQALTAAHRLPLNRLARPVTITTGRLLRTHGWPEGVDTLVVMLDPACAFEVLPDQDIRIWWGAYLGMPNEALVSGLLAEAGPAIAELKPRLRRENGWVMDVYLLRRGTAEGG